MKDKTNIINNSQNNWDLKKVKEITIEIFSGGTPYTQNQNFWDGGISWLSSGETKNRFIYQTERTITQSGVDNSSTRLTKKGDIVIASAGQGHTRGQVSYCMIDTYINQSVVALRANKKIISPRYLFYNLSSRYNEMRNISDSHSIRGSLTTKLLAEMKIQLPPLPEQHAIAYILSTLDDKIELNRQMNETLEAMAKAIFKSWFVDFDPVRAKMEGRKPYGMDEKTAALFPDEFEDSELGEIPKGWKIGKIEDICDKIENGGTPKRMENSYWEKGTIPWFKTGELRDKPLIESKELITKKGFENSSCKLWDSGTILIALYASPTVGRLGILEITGTSNQACSALKAKSDYGNMFLFQTLLASRVKLQNIAVGAAQQNINQKILREHKIILPPVMIATKYHNTSFSLYKQQRINVRQTHTLASIRDTLLPKLISGEIRIRDAEKFLKERGLGDKPA